VGAGAEAAGSVAEVVAVATGGTVMMTVEAAAAAMEVAAVAAMEVAAVAAMTTVAVAVVTTRMAVEIAAMTIEGNYRDYRTRCVVFYKLR
jgi:hypothetical protein